MSVTVAKLKKENDELRKRVDELETAVEEILWRLESGRPAAAPPTEKPKPDTKPIEPPPLTYWIDRLGDLRCPDCGESPCNCIPF